MRRLPVELPPEDPRRERGGSLFGLICLVAGLFALAWWVAGMLFQVRVRSRFVVTPGFYGVTACRPPRSRLRTQ